MPKLFITADWHLRPSPPRCRKDSDWLLFQENLVKEIVKIANNKKAILVIVGDIFDTPNVPSYIVSMLLSHILRVKMGTRILTGNHDLPFHSLVNIKNSSIGVLDTLINMHHHSLNYIDNLGAWSHFGGEEKNLGKELQFIHRLVFETVKDLPPNVSACTAQDLLDEYPNAKYIFIGDNHTKFHYQKKNRHVLNPGAIYRDTSDKKNYQPIVYYVDTDEDIIEEIPLPDNDNNLVDDNYIVEENLREDRITAFVEGVKKNGKVSLDFVKNIEDALIKNKKMSKETINMVRELMEEE